MKRSNNAAHGRVKHYFTRPWAGKALLYPYRTFSCNCDHCDSGGDAVAGSFGGPLTGKVC